MPKIIRVPDFPTDTEGNPLSGYVHVGTAENGDLVLDTIHDDHPGVEISQGPAWARYKRENLGDAIADRVLEAVWERSRGQETERIRDKIVAGLGRAPFMQTDLIPHCWLGESLIEPEDPEL